jgi:cardiolipin synthase
VGETVSEGTNGQASVTDEHVERPDEVVHHDIYSVANVITVARLALVPFFFSALISDNPRSNTLAFVLFAVAASTDFLDGLIARRTGTVTAIGKVIDPFVDRLLIASALVGLYMVERVSLWLLLTLVLRDLYLLYGAWVLERRQLRLPVTVLGKWTTAVLLVAFSSMIWDYPQVAIGGESASVGGYLVYAGLALSLATAVQYTILARVAVRDDE